MRVRFVAVAIATAFVAGSFAACKDNTVNQTSNTTNNFLSIGPKGGEVLGPDGTRVDVPAGALNETVNMGILEAASGEYPALPSGVAALGKVYAFHPHGQFFLIDATITMPAPNGEIDIYRAEPGGSWALFAKPKASNGLVRFRTSTFSFYVATKGTGGCVRDLDCFTGQTCVSNACVTGGDAGSGLDGGSDSGSAGDGGTTGCAVPAPSGKSGTITPTTGSVPTADGVATVKSGMDGTDYVEEIRIKFGDFTNMCGYATAGRLKANAQIYAIDLYRRSPTSAPPAFSISTPYSIGRRTSGGVEEDVNADKLPLDEICAAGDSAAIVTGSITLTEVTVDRIKGTYNITDDGSGGALSGSFDVPICNTTGTMPCCVK